jgi:hypothetical protein
VRENGNVDHDPHGEFTGRNILYQAHTVEETAQKFGQPLDQMSAALGHVERTLLEARAGYTMLLLMAGPPEAIHAVEDVDADGVPVRLYRPSADRALPVVVYLHGGGFTIGSVDGYDAVVRQRVDGGGGQVASTLVAGTNGIVVSAPATTTVTLRNIRINGIVGTPSGGLNGVQFLAGGAFSIADISIGTMFVNFDHAGEKLDGKRWPKLAAFVEKIHARPSFKAMLDEERPFVQRFRAA